jgi:hypothetical protein
MGRPCRAALLLFASLASCVPTEPTLDAPPGAVRFTPPPAYAAWYDATRACSGLAGSLERIEWLVVPGVDTFLTDQGPKVGLWERDGIRHRIVVAGNWRDHEMVVRHEMLHSLLGEAGHPSSYFIERCQLTWETWPGT